MIKLIIEKIVNTMLNPTNQIQMERIEKYREIIMRVFREYTEVSPAHGDLTDEIIVDRDSDRYLWMTRGYQKHKRIHACVVRIDIIDGKLWIQQDNTEGIAPELERFGYSKRAYCFRVPFARYSTIHRVCS